MSKTKQPDALLKEYEQTMLTHWKWLHAHPELSGQEVQTAIQLQGEENVATTTLTMGGEDFSFFAEKVPAAFYRIGCHREGTPEWPAHNGHFVPDEASLYHGAHIMIMSALNYLAQT